MKLQGSKTVGRRAARAAREVDGQVLDMILSATQPIKAYEMVRQSAAANALLPVQVYRSINRLTDMGRIERVATLNAFVATSVPKPLHLLCKDCGASSAAPASEVYDRIDKICSSAGFHIRRPYLEVSGKCQHCSNPVDA